MLDQTTEVVSNEEKVANEDGPAGNGEERESDGQKQSESTSDEQQKQQDQIEKEADTLKSDEQATVVEGEPTAVVGVQDTEKPESGDQHVEDKESAKVEEESVEGHAPTGEESGVIGVSVLNEPLADIVEEDEEQEPIKREELLAETKVRLRIDLISTEIRGALTNNYRRYCWSKNASSLSVLNFSTRLLNIWQRKRYNYMIIRMYSTI